MTTLGGATCRPHVGLGRNSQAVTPVTRIHDRQILRLRVWTAKLGEEGDDVLSRGLYAALQFVTWRHNLNGRRATPAR
jgi:hypothetical protein